MTISIFRGRLRLPTAVRWPEGVASIIKVLGSDAFSRLRVGISRPGGQNSCAPPSMDPADYVLQPFTAEQEKEMMIARVRAADAIELWLSAGIDAAMNAYNAAT
jgi:PTH1 family peptidyl-tRNA hydrolase